MLVSSVGRPPFFCSLGLGPPQTACGSGLSGTSVWRLKVVGRGRGQAGSPALGSEAGRQGSRDTHGHTLNSGEEKAALSSVTLLPQPLSPLRRCPSTDWRPACAHELGCLHSHHRANSSCSSRPRSPSSPPLGSVCLPRIAYSIVQLSHSGIRKPRPTKRRVV